MFRKKVFTAHVELVEASGCTEPFDCVQDMLVEVHPERSRSLVLEKIHTPAISRRGAVVRTLQ